MKRRLGKFIPVILVGSFLVVVAVGMAALQPGHTPIQTSQAEGSLEANITVGPTQPTCNANATTGPAGSTWSSVEAVITSSSEVKVQLHISWQTNGCEVFGTVTSSFSPGSYSLTLTSCCGTRTGLPKLFAITSGQTTAISVNVDTGIRSA